MISQFFVLSQRGDNIVFRDYRGEVQKGSAEIFFRKVKFWKEDGEGDAPPIFNVDGVNYFHVKVAGLLFAATTRVNVSPSLVLELLQRIARVVKDYLGVLNEDSLRKNFVLVYELLDEVIDFGYVQTTSTEVLKSSIFNEPIMVDAGRLPPLGPAAIFMQGSKRMPGTAVTKSVVANEPGGRKREEIFVDIIEKISVTFSSSGYILTSEIDGTIQMKSYLTGNPEIRLALNDDLSIGRSGRSIYDYNSSSGSGPVVLDDCNFHESVHLDSFDIDRTLTLIPPDGEFPVMNYRMTQEFKPPFRINALIEEAGPLKAEVIIKVFAEFASSVIANTILVQMPLPTYTTRVSFELEPGAVGNTTDYKEANKRLEWGLKKIVGGSEHTLRAKLTFSQQSHANITKEAGPVSMTFTIPMYNASRLQVKYLQIVKKLKTDNPYRWVRYVTQACFATHGTEPYGPVPKYRGKCEIDPDTKRDFCNGKIIGAQHFAKAAIAAKAFNPAVDFASPLDGDGHGSHTAAIAAGNNGIPVRMHGHEFGKASGMAPRARIAVYKALYRLFGGFIADVVAAIDQAVYDGVDILSLSVGPNSPPATTKTTYLNPFDATLLSAVKAGIFVAQAAGNGGPFQKTLVSYSPWIASVAAAVDDRRYKNHLTLGNGKILPGLGLSPSTHGNRSYTMVAANDVLLDSSVMKYSPSDCQKPEVLNKNLVEGNILLCGYSFNFVVGTASIKKVSETAKSLGAIGFVLVVENVSPGTKFDPVPVGIPGILITDVSKSMDLIDYYNITTTRDWTGRVKSFKSIGSIGDGLMPILHKSAPQVALFSARGPNIKDFSFQDADLLKPDILAPGSLIWAAWSPNGTDEPNYVGEGFAMISGTSMAAPHIAGIAALIKQKHPHWSPAAIKSALMTTSTTEDRAGRPIQAQQYSETEAMKLVTATPFDYGSGHVNPRAALDPGLIFDAGYGDYLGFLCTTPGIDIHEIRNYTNSPCNLTIGHPWNLNTPSITVAHLVRTQTITRTVTNVAEEETYVITTRMAPAIAIEANPPAMTLKPGASRKFSITLTVRSVTGTYSFGEVLMKGSRHHKVRIPVVAMGYER